MEGEEMRKGEEMERKKLEHTPLTTVNFRPQICEHLHTFT